MSANERVKQLRKMLELSQSLFAKAIYISVPYLAGIESGTRNVDDKLVRFICIAFPVNEDWLRTGRGCMFQDHSDRMSVLATAVFEQLKPDYQKFMLKQMGDLLTLQHEEWEK